MTYTNPETEPNRLTTSIPKILHLGIAAAQQQNWLSVCNYLKSLPQTKSRNQPKQFVLNSKDWQVAYNLAILVLIEADFQHKWEISKSIPLFGSNVISPLITLIKDETVEADIRWFICKILGKFNDRRVVVAIVQLLQQTTDEELIEIAGKTLIEIGDDAVAALSDLLTQPEYCLLAVQSLSYIRTAKTIEPLLKVTTHPDGKLRAIAIKALGSFHDSRIPSVLITALQDKASKVRLEATTALGYREDLCDELDLISHFSILLSDFDLKVCRQSTISLGRMRRETATKALFEAMQAETTPISLKLDLVKALGWSRIDSAIHYLEQAIFSSSGVVTQEIITILGRTSQSELKSSATQTLLNFWQVKHQELTTKLKQSLATSLGELGCHSAKSVLEQLAADRDQKVKLHAQSALKKILQSKLT